MTALGLYEHSGVSLGWCAHIAGMHIEDFMLFLGEHEGSVFRYDSEEEFLSEAANA
jgi:predicted HTH domain antitoxin